MSPQMKSGFQLLIATIIGLILYFGPPQWDYVGVPGFSHFFQIGWWIIPVTIVVMFASSNAVNLTDGLDSMAGSTSVVAFAAYGTIAYLQDQVYLAVFCFILVGALMGFLWYNAYPAQLFMGDTGSLALGATLGLISIMTGQWLLLPLIGLVFAIEAISVMLQVGYFKLTKRFYGEGRRLFKMAPLHHHFELKGWSEMQVKERFFIISILAGMLGVALALI